MIKNKIVLILGAGASAPYGFPLGRDLMWEVIRKIETENMFNNLLIQLGFKLNHQREFANELKIAMQPSLDAFLENRGKDFMEIGKAALAAALIPYENAQDLMKTDFELSPNSGRWYNYLLNLLGNRDEFAQNNLSIITFNYDRSLEYFLYYALRPRFGIDDQNAIELIQAIRVVHIYGQLGKPQFLDQSGRLYNGEVDAEIIKKLASEINIIHEDVGTTPNLVKAQHLIQQADLLVFLGFGYHRMNVDRLKIRDYYVSRGMLQAVGTGYGRADGEIERDVELLINQGLFRQYIQLYTYQVLDFLRNTNYLQ